MREGSADNLDTGARANLVWFRQLAHQHSPLGEMGPPRLMTHPGGARFKFRNGRMGDVRFAVDIAMGIGGAKGSFTTFVLDSDTPALWIKGALEAPGGRLDFSRDTLTLGLRGWELPSWSIIWDATF